MVERVCPECQHGNPLDNRFCGRCGASLERQLPAPTGGGQTAITLAGHSLPVTWKQVGQTVAVGLTALVAEAGMAWLRRKIEQVTLPSPPTTKAPTTAIVPARNTSQASGDVVTIISQRVVEVWEQGTLKRQVVERNFWRKEQ
jgi:hypothetical protein